MKALREELKGKLSKKEQEALRAGYDMIGDIAIIEVPRKLEKKKKLIAKAVMKMNANIRVVAVKKGGHKGAYRKQKLEILLGEKRLETTQKESGAVFKLNVEQCYYSPRLAGERLRIAKLVKKGERILVAGSGIGPYPIIIAKHSKAKEIIGIEMNKKAHEYAVQNVKANKLVGRVALVNIDVKKIKLGKFDRIISAMPHKGMKTIPGLLISMKKGTMLHIMDFADEEKIFFAGDKLKKICPRCKILRIVKAGQYAARKYRICVDAKYC